MRHLFAASILAISAFGLAACNENPGGTASTSPASTAAAPAVDPAAIKTAVDEALAARDAEDTKIHADAGPAVYFVNLRDGETVSSPFRVVFGVYGMGVAPALTAKDLTGHHHLLIDTELSAEEMKFAIPNDDKHVHYGTGATEAQLMLPAGQHTLQIVFGNKNHEQFSPPIMSKKITINVK